MGIFANAAKHTMGISERGFFFEISKSELFYAIFKVTV